MEEHRVRQGGFRNGHPLPQGKSPVGRAQFFPVKFLCSKDPSPCTAREPSLQSLLQASGAIGTETLPEDILVLDSPSLLPRLAGHYGLIFTGLILLLYLPLTLRGTSVAVSARTRFHAVMAILRNRTQKNQNYRTLALVGLLMALFLFLLLQKFFHLILLYLLFLHHFHSSILLYNYMN